MTSLLQSSIKLVALLHLTFYITLIFIYRIFKLCYAAFTSSQVWAVGRLPLTTNNTTLNINGKGIQVGCFVPTCPESIQQATTPRDHQSTAWPYGSILTTSGAEIIELTFLFQFRKRLGTEVNSSSVVSQFPFFSEAVKAISRYFIFAGIITHNLCSDQKWTVFLDEMGCIYHWKVVHVNSKHYSKPNKKRWSNNQTRSIFL